MAERVDKHWKDKGLSAYSTAAIVGTLNHYGVALDEAALKQAGADQVPLELAGTWKAAWTGKGQFATFPYAAANELLTRFYPERPTPMKLATTLIELIAACMRRLDGQSAELELAFAGWDAAATGLPPEGHRRDMFVGEVVGYLEPWAKPFGDLPQLLAKNAHPAEATRFALVHEALFPDKKGCATAVVRATSGEREPVVAELSAWAGEPGRDVFARYAALDALFQLEAWEAIRAHGLAVFDLAAEQAKWTLADAAAHLLARVTDELSVDQAFLAEVERRLDRAHAMTGGHHHHG